MGQASVFLARGARAFSADALTAECVEELQKFQPAVICICTVRYRQCLRHDFAHTKLVILAWGASEEAEEIQQRLGAASSDVVVKTVGHAVDQAGLLASNIEATAEPREPVAH